MSFTSQAIFFYGIVLENKDLESFQGSKGYAEDYDLESNSLGNCGSSGNPIAIYDQKFAVEMNSCSPFKPINTVEIKIPIGTNEKFKKFFAAFDIEYTKPCWQLGITSY